MNKELFFEKIRSNQDLLNEFSIKSLAVFGSVIHGEQNQESDVDILVEFEPDARIGLFKFIKLRNSLSELLGCSVDLVTKDALHPALKDKILTESIYVT